MLPYKNTAKEVSIEWSHHRIPSTDSKVRTALHVSPLLILGVNGLSLVKDMSPHNLCIESSKISCTD